jgi:Ca-activated chloride channel homolog
VRVLIALSLAFALHAQASASSSQERPDINLRVNTTLVVIPVTVTDASNRFVLGLGKQNFSIFEDGVRQSISQFAAEDAPLSVGLLVDTSGSMGMKLATSRQAVSEVLKILSPADEAFLVEFSDRAELAVPFTRDFAGIEAKLGTAESQGLTALLDAIELGIKEMKTARNPRKALLIISDGGDNNSRYTAQEIQNLVRAADVQIYSLGVFEPLSNLGLSEPELSGPRLLAEVSEQTGGRAFPARNFSALPALARKIAIELRNQYILAYSPTKPDRDGTYRKVEVKLTAPEGLTALKVRWRLGYYAPAQ